MVLIKHSRSIVGKNKTTMEFNFNQYKLELLGKTKCELFYNLIQENKSRLEDFFAGTVKKTTSLGATNSFCGEAEKKIKNKEYFPYLIIEVETDKIVGLIDIKNIDWNIPKAELGAFIDKKFEGKGIITNYINFLIDKIVEEHQFKKLLCRIAPENKRSIQVAINCGFELEGMIRRDYRTSKGRLVDLNYYGKIY